MSAKNPPGNWRWISKFHCSTYPNFGLLKGARVGEPFVATKFDSAAFPPVRPGGGKIPAAPNGPGVAHVKLPKLCAVAPTPPVNEQSLASRVDDGVNP